MAFESPFELPIGQNYSQDRLEKILKRAGGAKGRCCVDVS